MTGEAREAHRRELFAQYKRHEIVDFAVCRACGCEEPADEMRRGICPSCRDARERE